MKSIAINLAGNEESLAMTDRGLAYGDGVFETILIHAGKPVWWELHWQRLVDGARRLKITTPDESVVRNACENFLGNHQNNVLKIILTRGAGGRGYAVPAHTEPRIVLSLYDLPSQNHGPVRLRWCDTRLARQPLLAGIKHLNRLEQVLARNEWNDDSAFDGLMCDTENNVVCATSANVFAMIEGQWQTPPLDQAGIAGIARAWVLKQWPQVQQAHLSRLQIEQAEAIFICNAVRGILAVNCLGEKTFSSVHSDILDLQNRLRAEQPGFALGEHGDR